MRDVLKDYGLRPNDKVTVCASCWRASCWQGEFYCDQFKTADILETTVRVLWKAKREHPHYWRQGYTSR